MSEIALNIFKENIGKVVLVELKGGRSVRGKLYSFDQHMNLVLEDAEDISEENPKKIGMVIIRGDNVVLVSPPPKKPEENQTKK